MNARLLFLFGTAWACLAIGGSDLCAADVSVAELIGKLKSSDEAAQLDAIDQIAARGEQAADAVSALVELLKNPSAKVRAHAIRSLGEIGAPAKPAVAAISQLFKDPDETVRRQIIPAVRAINPGPQVTVPLCVKLLEDSDPGVRVRILSTIAEAGTAAMPGLLEALKNDKAAYWACVILRSIGPSAKDAVPALALRLKDPRPEVRREVILALGTMDEAAIPVIPQIAAALKDEQTRTAATFVLGQLGQLPAKAEATVLANAKSSDHLLSTVSIWTIARAHPADKSLTRHALEHLIAGLKDEDKFVREVAARALLALPPAPEIAGPIWEKAFQNMDETTARNALDALATLGAPAVPRLIAALKYPALRAEVADVLGHIGPDSAPAATALAKLIDDKNARVSHAAALALANIGPGAKAAVPVLVEALESGDESNADVATAYAFALGKIGPDAAAGEPVLIKLLKSADPNLSLVCAWSLTRIHPASAEVAAKVVPVLISGLAAPSPASRQSAAEALGNLGPLAKSATADLKKALTDEDKAVQDAATKALAAIGKGA